MFHQKLQALVGGDSHGWKARAAALLGVTRPTLNRYLKLAATGEASSIPAEVLSLVGVEPKELDQKAKPQREAGGDPYDMVNLFAAGLCKLQEHMDQFARIQAPYPEPLFRGFNLAAAINLERGTTYPMDLATLVRAADRPLFEWCSEYGEGEHGDGYIASRMIEGGQVTSDCIAMAGLVDVDAEELFYKALMAVCGEVATQDAESFYAQWRKAVIENPVAESITVFLSRYKTLRAFTTSTRQLVDVFYERVPETFAENGRIALCPLTKTRLRKVGGRWVGEMRDPAAAKALAEQGPLYMDVTPATLELKRPARVFWALPGWHELRLADEVQSRGWSVKLWPDFDKFDLLVSKPGGSRFAVDVKDHLSPHSLSRSVGNSSRRGKMERLLVIPDYLRDRIPLYVSIFSRARRSALMEPESIMTVSDFLERLEAES